MTRAEFIQQAVLTIVRTGNTQEHAIEQALKLAQKLEASKLAPWSDPSENVLLKRIEDEAHRRGYLLGEKDGRAYEREDCAELVDADDGVPGTELARHIRGRGEAPWWKDSAAPRRPEVGRPSTVDKDVRIQLRAAEDVGYKLGRADCVALLRQFVAEYRKGAISDLKSIHAGSVLEVAAEKIEAGEYTKHDPRRCTCGVLSSEHGKIGCTNYTPSDGGSK